jgi:hypothetical protein
MSVQENSHPVEDTTVFIHGGIAYLPKYTEPGVYVGPGYRWHNGRTYSKNELLQAGAVETKMMLWPRVKKAASLIGS